MVIKMKDLSNTTAEELARTIEEALFDYQHTPDLKAKEQYNLIIQTASQDYYTLTGNWYHHIEKSEPINNVSSQQENEYWERFR